MYRQIFITLKIKRILIFNLFLLFKSIDYETILFFLYRKKDEDWITLY